MFRRTPEQKAFDIVERVKRIAKEELIRCEEHDLRALINNKAWLQLRHTLSLRLNDLYLSCRRADASGDYIKMIQPVICFLEDMIFIEDSVMRINPETDHMTIKDHKSHARLTEIFAGRKGRF